jgi:hypothetical protein
MTALTFMWERLRKLDVLGVAVMDAPHLLFGEIREIRGRAPLSLPKAT